MKKISTLCLGVALAIPGFGQLVVQNSGITIGPGATLYTQGLVLTPSSGLAIQNTTFQVSTVPVTSAGGASISRVVNISPAFNFSGTVGLKYQASELNGNTESQLAIAFNNGATGNNFTTLTSFDSAAGTYYVYSPNLTNISLGRVTAVNNNVVLPIVISEFSARAKEPCAIVLEWTSQKASPGNFEVQWSAEGRRWKKKAGAVTAMDESHFTWIDDTPVNGNNFYRLATRLHDEPTYYTATVAQPMYCGNERLVIHPNPGKDYLTVSSGLTPATTVTVTLLDITGHLVQVIKDYQPGAKIGLEHIAAGTYIIRYHNGATTLTGKFLKR